MDDEDHIDDPTDAEVRLTALGFALEFSNRNPQPTAATVLADAEAFSDFLQGKPPLHEVRN